MYLNFVLFRSCIMKLEIKTGIKENLCDIKAYCTLKETLIIIMHLSYLPSAIYPPTPTTVTTLIRQAPPKNFRISDANDYQMNTK